MSEKKVHLHLGKKPKTIGEFVFYADTNPDVGFAIYGRDVHLMSSKGYLAKMNPLERAAFQEFSRNFVYDSRWWNYSFQASGKDGVVFEKMTDNADGETHYRLKNEVKLNGTNGDGRPFYYQLVLQAMDIYTKPGQETRLTLNLNTPATAPPPAPNIDTPLSALPPVTILCSIVNADVTISSEFISSGGNTVGDVVLNSGVELVEPESKVDVNVPPAFRNNLAQAYLEVYDNDKEKADEAARIHYDGITSTGFVDTNNNVISLVFSQYRPAFLPNPNDIPSDSSDDK